MVSDRRDHRQAEQCDGAAERLIGEAQQVRQRAAAARDDHRLDARDRGEVAERAHDRGCGMAILDGRERPHQPPRPAAPRERGEHVVACLAALGGDHADRARQLRAVQSPLVLEQALGVELAAQALDPREQIALAGHAQIEYREGEPRRGGRAAGVVVAAAGDDDLHALARRTAGARGHRLPVLQPGAARDRPGRVAQLEVHAGARGAQVDELAHHLHARERAQLQAQRGGVLADRKRPGERAVGNARGGAPGGGEER